MQTSLQLDLDFSRPAMTGAGDERVAELLNTLNGQGWVTSREIRAAKGWEDRTIRLLAAASDGQVLSGQHGYKLTSQATPEEMMHATSWLESQAREMSNRARAIRRRWHGSGRPAPL
jgi:hypothetical protein